jgi:transcriptional regulator with XRE-family HTH domain
VHHQQIPRHDTSPPDRWRLRTRIFDKGLWSAYDIHSLTELAEKMEVTTGALSKLMNDHSREPSAAIIRSALFCFRGKRLCDLFFLERER